MPRKKKEPNEQKNGTRRRLEKEVKSNRGRKKIKANFQMIQREINFDQVLYWIGLQATAEEIAGSFRVSISTLDLRLKEHFGMNFTDLKKSLGNGADGKLTLRRHQLRLAETNASVNIWLGKQWLDQKDIVHQKTTLEEDSSIKVYLPDNNRDSKDTA